MSLPGTFLQDNIFPKSQKRSPTNLPPPFRVRFKKSAPFFWFVIYAQIWKWGFEKKEKMWKKWGDVYKVLDFFTILLWAMILPKKKTKVLQDHETWPPRMPIFLYMGGRNAVLELWWPCVGLPRFWYRPAVMPRGNELIVVRLFFLVANWSLRRGMDRSEDAIVIMHPLHSGCW